MSTRVFPRGSFLEEEDGYMRLAHIMWAPSGASLWASVGSSCLLAQRELDTNLLGQARTAEENKQITNNYLESQI